MTTWARVVGGFLVDVTEVNPKSLHHPDVASQFVDVPDGVKDGAHFVDGVWVNPQQPGEKQDAG